MEVPLFELVGHAVRVALEPADGDAPVRIRAHRRGLKVWFGDQRPARQHYEAQLIPRRYVDGEHGTALEIGFHAEENDGDANTAALDALKGHERRWRKVLGEEAEAGPFLGRDGWTRISEVWIEPDLEEPDLVPEITDRLVRYIEALEPIRSRS